MYPRTRHISLLENERGKHWCENPNVKSSTTSEVYLRNLGLWLELIRRDPDPVIELVTFYFEGSNGQFLTEFGNWRRMARRARIFQFH